MYFIQLPVKNKFSYKENSTLTEKTHNKERLLREEGGALLIPADEKKITQSSLCYSGLLL